MSRSIPASAGRRLAWICAGVLLAGCAAQVRNIEPRPGPLAGVLPADAEARAEAVRRDPLAYLQQVLDNCRELKQYTVLFTRYERRGLFPRLYGPEHIQCWFRRQPFSVRMKWLDPNVKHDESTYVEGQENNQVRFVTRRPVPLLVPPPGVNKVDLQTPVIWGESKRPLTHFGLERLMERTLESIKEAGQDVVISYAGLEQLPETGATVHHLHLAYSPTRYRVPVQELYIDVMTDLPAGTLLKLASGELDAAYFYADLKTDVQLTDEEFLLAGERESQVKRAGRQTKPAMR